MLLSAYYLKDEKRKLESIVKTITTNSDLTVLKKKIFTSIGEILFSLEELKFCTDTYSYASKKDEVLQYRNVIKNSNEVNIIKNNLQNIIDLIDLDINNLATYHFKRSMVTFCTTYTPLDINTVKILSQLFLYQQQRKFNILDSRCYHGETLKQLTEENDCFNTYGIEPDQNCAKIATNNVQKIAIGQLTGSRISNNVFDIMLEQPNVSWNAGTFDNQSPYTLKKEKTHLNSHLKFLRPNGILVFTIPYFRLYKDICLILSKNLKNVQVFRTNEFNNYGTIIITGIKKEDNKEPDAELFRQLRSYHDPALIPIYNNEEIKPYQLPNQSLEIETFRGSVLDNDQLLKLISTSGNMDNFWKNQSIEKLSEAAKQPLLPFNIGQLGLVLTSGCLDGIIDEGDGHCHLIKGKVSKKSDIERNYNDNSEVEVQETISNRVEINVLLPNGEFKTLA